MKSLKKIVKEKLLILTAILMAVILLIALFFQIISTQKQARGNASAMFLQVNQIIDESEAELKALKKEYEETCLSNADTISYILKLNPEILETSMRENGKGALQEIGTPAKIEEFKQLAMKLEIDEIHIFNDEGCIFTGTHHEYTGFTFDDGAQIGFFKSMLTDKKSSLVQPITPNTAEGKEVQYSAMWSSDGKYIIQVGMYPDAVSEATEKSELSYIFSLLRGTPGVSMYAVNPFDGTIIGSTSEIYNGQNISKIGLPLSSIVKYEKGAHATVNGVDSYCIFKNIDDLLIGYTISNDELYSNIAMYTLILALCLAVIAVVLVIIVQKFTEHYIIGSISATNERLRAVAEGNLDGRADIKSSQEFSELSSHINYMIHALLADTEKINLVLNRTNMRIGVYEYNTKMKTVRITEHIPEIFALDSSELLRLTSDYREMQAFIDKLKNEPVSDEKNTYRLIGNSEMYIKLEEFNNINTVLGIVMDVTEETVSRRLAESERDHDLMTGLYNRRGMERIFDKLFQNPTEMGCGALIMIDTDNLKHVNDTYGHAVGDIYLKHLAEIIENFDSPEHIAARTGGDEFVLLIYGYKSDEEVENALIRFSEYQDKTTVNLENGINFPLFFSYGYELTHGRRDHEHMLSMADVHMYNSKRARKKAFRDQKAMNENI